MTDTQYLYQYFLEQSALEDGRKECDRPEDEPINSNFSDKTEKKGAMIND